MFDKKFIIIKPWQLEIEMKKDVRDSIPVWIRLPRLNVNNWKIILS